MRSPIFPPDPQEPRRNNAGLYALIGGVALFVLLLGVMLTPGKVELREVKSISYRVGSDFPLYGKTLADKDFDWESLRGNYVLVKFTATWCPPCRAAVPGMLEAYEKYHDKGFEIVSVYIGEREPNAVATVERFVEREKLPWIILSEALTVKDGQTPQGAAFGIDTIPKMVLVDKEGKVISIGPQYAPELRKVFGE